MITITQLLNTPETIERLTNATIECNKKRIEDNSNLKLLEKQRDFAVKSSQNIIKAIEQGIITEMTKDRLKELEQEIIQLNIDIEKEKHKNNTYLTKEEIMDYIAKNLLTNCEEIKMRKLLIILLLDK